jgi:hypothetical protein
MSSEDTDALTKIENEQTLTLKCAKVYLLAELNGISSKYTEILKKAERRESATFHIEGLVAEIIKVSNEAYELKRLLLKIQQKTSGNAEIQSMLDQAIQSADSFIIGCTQWIEYLQKELKELKDIAQNQNAINKSTNNPKQTFTTNQFGVPKEQDGIQPNQLGKDKLENNPLKGNSLEDIMKQINEEKKNVSVIKDKITTQFTTVQSKIKSIKDESSLQEVEKELENFQKLLQNMNQSITNLQSLEKQENAQEKLITFVKLYQQDLDTFTQELKTAKETLDEQKVVVEEAPVPVEAEVVVEEAPVPVEAEVEGVQAIKNLLTEDNVWSPRNLFNFCGFGMSKLDPKKFTVSQLNEDSDGTKKFTITAGGYLEHLEEEKLNLENIKINDNIYNGTLKRIDDRTSTETFSTYSLTLTKKIMI